MNEENTRDEAQVMCKSYANELYAGNIGDLGKNVFLWLFPWGCFVNLGR